jgi:hypothetical protein
MQNERSTAVAHMKIIEIDAIHSESLQRFFYGFPCVFRGAVDNARACPGNDTKLGRQKDFVAFSCALEPGNKTISVRNDATR